MHLGVKLPATTLDEYVSHSAHTGKELSHGEMGEAISGTPGQDLLHCGPQFQRERSHRAWEEDRPPGLFCPQDRSAQSSLEMLRVGGKLRPEGQEVHLRNKGSFPTKTIKQGLRCLGTAARVCLAKTLAFLQLTHFASSLNTDAR